MQGWGNVKLRGKKYKLLSCRCCEVFNHKHEKAIDEMNADIRTSHLLYDLDQLDREEVIGVREIQQS